MRRARSTPSLTTGQLRGLGVTAGNHTAPICNVSSHTWPYNSSSSPWMASASSTAPAAAWSAMKRGDEHVMACGACGAQPLTQTTCCTPHHCLSALQRPPRQLLPARPQLSPHTGRGSRHRHPPCCMHYPSLDTIVGSNAEEGAVARSFIDLHTAAAGGRAVPHCNAPLPRTNIPLSPVLHQLHY